MLGGTIVNAQTLWLVHEIFRFPEQNWPRLAHSLRKVHSCRNQLFGWDNAIDDAPALSGHRVHGVAGQRQLHWRTHRQEPGKVACPPPAMCEHLIPVQRNVAFGEHSRTSHESATTKAAPKQFLFTAATNDFLIPSPRIAAIAILCLIVGT